MNSNGKVKTSAHSTNYKLHLLVAVPISKETNTANHIKNYWTLPSHESFHVLIQFTNWRRKHFSPGLKYKWGKYLMVKLHVLVTLFFLEEKIRGEERVSPLKHLFFIDWLLSYGINHVFTSFPWQFIHGNSAHFVTWIVLYYRKVGNKGCIVLQADCNKLFWSWRSVKWIRLLK